MGNCLSPNTEERASSKIIELELQRLMKGNNATKLLLLGPGESGKSTLVKQLRLIYSNGFTREEMASYKPNIHSNIILSMSALIKALIKSNQYDELDEELKLHAQKLMSPDIFVLPELNEDLAKSISLLWENQLVKERFQNKSDVQIIDSAAYFFTHIDRIACPDYVPTEQDIILCRVKTSGITEFSFCFGGTPIRLVDVGGQRTERRKWIHCFEDVSAIFFVAAVNEYDERLRENEKVSRIHESLNLLAEITSQPYFRDTTVILLLNKVDLLEEKLKRIPFKKYFRDYTGDEELQQITAFLRKKFVEKQRSSSKLYSHISCATSTENVKFIFGSLEKQILDESLSSVGLPLL